MENRVRDSQPAFSGLGKISHDFSRQQTPDGIRIVNVVEVTCPLFQRAKLAAFMDVYDGSLVGWGIDFWYSNFSMPTETPALPSLIPFS